jgi:hypothetical protein
MPSTQPIPTLADLRQAYNDGIVGQRERRADTHDGSAYDLLGGMSAMLFSRQVQRDRDLFRANYFDSAEGEDLTSRVSRLYVVARVLDTYGIGTVSLARPNASAGAGVIPAGTRIVIYASSGTTDPRIFAVTADTPVSATATTAAPPVRATTTGAGTSMTLSVGLAARIDDPLWDSTWSVVGIQTADGTAFEKAEDYRARVRTQFYANRAGYAAAIILACQGVGATNVVPYPSNWTGDATDVGYNALYVGDASFNGSPALVQACTLTLESVRVLGADLQILQLASQSLTVSVTASLYDDPGSFNTTDLTLAIQAAIGAYFDGRKNAFSYQIDAIAGAVFRASPAVQGATVNAPTSSVGVTQAIGGIQNFPAVLTRYVVVPGNVQVAFVGPQ